MKEAFDAMAAHPWVTFGPGPSWRSPAVNPGASGDVGLTMGKAPGPGARAVHGHAGASPDAARLSRNAGCAPGAMRPR